MLLQTQSATDRSPPALFAEIDEGGLTLATVAFDAWVNSVMSAIPFKATVPGLQACANLSKAELSSRDNIAQQWKELLPPSYRGPNWEPIWAGIRDSPVTKVFNVVVGSLVFNFMEEQQPHASVPF